MCQYVGILACMLVIFLTFANRPNSNEVSRTLSVALKSENRSTFTASVSVPFDSSCHVLILAISLARIYERLRGEIARGLRTRTG